MMIHKTTFSGVKEKKWKSIVHSWIQVFQFNYSQNVVIYSEVPNNCKLLCFIKEMKFIKFIYPFSRTYFSGISIENGHGHMVLFYKGSEGIYPRNFVGISEMM